MNREQQSEIVDILKRRANEVATFRQDLEQRTGVSFISLPGSVEMALSREVERLRGLASAVEGVMTEFTEPSLTITP